MVAGGVLSSVFTGVVSFLSFLHELTDISAMRHMAVTVYFKFFIITISKQLKMNRLKIYPGYFWAKPWLNSHFKTAVSHHFIRLIN
jgi:hypothetical protein